MSTVLTINAARLARLEAAARTVLEIVADVRRGACARVCISKKGVSIDGSTVGERVARARKRLRIKQKDLAAAANMSPAQLCQIEHGRVSPSVVMARRIADALGVPVADIVS